MTQNSQTEPAVARGGVDRPAGLFGTRVLCFEARRATELCGLLSRYGASARSVAAIREVEIDPNPAAYELAHRLEREELQAVVCLTQVAVDALVKACAQAIDKHRLVDLLNRTTVVSRGPKPRAALRRLGVSCEATTDEPHTWREVASCVDRLQLQSKAQVAVLEYGSESPQLVTELTERGLEVACVRLYRWDLPADKSQLTQAVSQLARASEVDIALFTSGRQVDHVMQIAQNCGLAEQVIATARRAVVVASIGPACSRALRGHGLPVDIEPEHPKMGHLVRELARRGDELFAAKHPRGSKPSAV